QNGRDPQADQARQYRADHHSPEVDDPRGLLRSLRGVLLDLNQLPGLGPDDRVELLLLGRRYLPVGAVLLSGRVASFQVTDEMTLHGIDPLHGDALTRATQDLGDLDRQGVAVVEQLGD